MTPTAFDWTKADTARARADTCAADQLIHLNNAGAALPPDMVVDAVVDHLRLEQRIGAYEAAEAARDEQRRVYEALAVLVGARPTEIALVDSATRAWIAAFSAIRFRPGQRILTCVSEYASNFIAYLQAAKRWDVRIQVLPNDETGTMSADVVAAALDDDVALVAATHVPTNSGVVAPVEEIGEVVRESPALYFVDACQSAGQLPVNVQAIGCDVLTATGRKFLRGPRGTGFLYVDPGRLAELEPVCADLHSASWVATHEYKLRDDAGRFELWENNVSTRLGLGAAAEYARAFGIEKCSSRIRELAHRLRDQLIMMPRIRVWDAGETLSGIVTFTADGWTPADLTHELRSRSKINIWHVGSDSALLDMSKRGLSSVARASVHYFNTEEEIDALAQALETLVLAQEG
jgi:selenocysteine lyase/cysteine desulfurase